MLLRRWGAQEPAAHHWRKAQRHKAGHENRHSYGDRELVQQPAQDPAHEKHGNKHGSEGESHRQNRKADLFRAAKRRLQHPLSHLHVPDDVLQHHDCIVYHKPDRKRESH